MVKNNVPAYLAKSLLQFEEVFETLMCRKLVT